MEGGWIKIHRRFLEWEWYSDSKMVHLFLHLLLMANHEDKKWKGETITRGQVLTSRERLSAETGLSVQNVRTCLLHFEKTGEITRKSTNKETIITISNYDKYQVKEDIANQLANQQLTSNQPATNQPTNKNDKNINICVLDNTPAYAREGGVKEDWRFISSVRQSTLGFDKNRIAEFKRNLFRAEVEALAEKVGMIPEQKEAFISWWTESSPNSDKIKAEYEVTFDTENRMRIWADRHKPSQKTQQPKSRMDQLEEDLKFIDNFFYGQQQHNSAPDEQ